MKNKYFAIISRDEFIKLYRFGDIHTSITYIVKNDARSSQALENIFKQIPFEYEEGYLILEFEDQNFNLNNEFGKISIAYKLDIKSIKNVYVLSEKAKNFYSIKFNPKIHFQVIPFFDMLENIQKCKELEDMDKGADVLLEQFQIFNKEKIEGILGNDFKEKFIESLIVSNYLNKEYDFYFDLLSYKRENKFTKKDVGFLFDLMIILRLESRDPLRIQEYKQGELHVDFSVTYQQLSGNEKDKLIEYIEFLKINNTEKVKQFISKLGMDKIVIGSIFLKLKSTLDENNGRKDGYQRELQKLVADFNTDEYKNELGVALYFIGLMFGYKGLYDDYYDFLDLAIYRKEIIEECTKEVNNSAHDDEDDNIKDKCYYLIDKLDDMLLKKIKKEIDPHGKARKRVSIIDAIVAKCSAQNNEIIKSIIVNNSLI